MPVHAPTARSPATEHDARVIDEHVDVSSGGCAIGVFAHPDDEVFCAGGTMALWAASGVRVDVVTATRGEAGQIRDAALATRRTLGAVREDELRRACAQLGIAEVTVLEYLDGTLRDQQPGELEAVIEGILVERDPDVVVTFGADGAYGHPDHVAVGEATAAAVERIWTTRGDELRPRLLRSHFPRSRLSLADRLASWLVELQERFDGSADYGRALSLFAHETTTMRFASDDVRVVWYPPGSFVVEQGEPATSLCLILSGTVDVVQEVDDERHHLRTLGEGQFFGELGVVSGGARSASVIAVGNVTCLVLSPSAPTKFAGRGATAQRLAEDSGEGEPSPYVSSEAQDPAPDDAVRVDVREHVGAKLAALAAHRTQYPIDVDAFPRPMLEEMFGIEYFMVHHPGGVEPL